ncbi:MAG: DNA polymerase III subunit gamma/tau [Alphaproteobacteria bacterium]|nr:DNA polymerase III subunit gamma/tau [Alphaproteobacteria bacterium]
MTQENENHQYVALARKYRPQKFEDLLGQDALVQTLTNAIQNNRLHHAYILTGIRGVGKTTTARLIARAINCIGPDGKGGPTIHPCGECENCKAIAADRHIDVIELDAASKTGVDDMREILDGVRYKPTNARYKVYIIDEVHMLSKSAFNALLKTLEEPPAHVKFIFATTEIRKVPVTILSRCQRFDLQRLSIETLMTLFNKIVKAENIEAEEEALQMVARAADGSARDGLSMLDQAIVLGNGNIKADTVKNMLGLADRQQTMVLYEKLLAGDISAVMENLQAMYTNGSVPTVILQDLIDITHLLAKVKIVPAFINDASLSENDREMCKKMCDAPINILSKIWQMLIKGLSEIQYAAVQIDALEMILMRIAYSASLPSPSDLLKELKKKSGLNKNTPAVTSEIMTPSEVSDVEDSGVIIETTAELLKLLTAKKQPLLLFAVKNDLSFKEFADGRMHISVSEKADKNLIANLRNFLKKETGKNWQIDIDYEPLGETLAMLEAKELDKDKKNISEYPLVKAILSEFNGAKIETIIRKNIEDAENESETEFVVPEPVNEIYEEEN